jgi:hypothetical protein
LKGGIQMAKRDRGFNKKSMENGLKKGGMKE